MSWLRRAPAGSRAALAICLTSAACWALAPPSPAAAATPAPAWTITSARASTIFSPGDSSGADSYLVSVTNSGGAPSDGTPITITDNLPSGLTLHPPGASASEGLSCLAGPPLSCTSSAIVPPGGVLSVEIPLDVAPGAPASVINAASVAGGGASFASSTESTAISTASAGFGLQSVDGIFTAVDGSTDAQAGSHPYEMTTSLNFTTAPGAAGKPLAAGSPKDIEVRLPPGVLGDPQAVAKCSFQELRVGINEPDKGCPIGSQIGVVTLRESTALFPNTDEGTFAVYNMVPPGGRPAELGFQVAGVPVLIDAGLRTGSDYGVDATVTDASAALPLTGSTLTLWGVPADPSHDSQRCPAIGITTGVCGGVEAANEPHSAGAPPVPFLTLPTSCAGPQATAIEADSWQQPGRFAEASFLSHDEAGGPVGFGGCNRLDFSPTIAVRPDTSAADSPAGLQVELHIPQSSEGRAEANLKDAAVTLPNGLVVNPSSASGLAGCSEAQVGYKAGTTSPIEFTPDPAECPGASKIGTVEVETPLLDHPLKGAVYVAKPGENPFNSLLAIYIAVADPQTGIVVKLAGHIDPNEETGQLQTTFSDNPQLPFEDFKLDFFGGPRAPLTTPPICGRYMTTTDLKPWSAPQSGPDATPQSSFDLSSGPSGSACAPSEAAEPNAPSFEAGTTSPIAGAYSPFVLKLSRADGSQRLRSIDTTLPEGLLGKLAGLTECSNAQIASAQGRTKIGDGAIEQASPSCPASSEVGTVTVGAGAGPAPYYATGRAYLAGPYKGAPLSLEVITPAVAGPYDLGAVAVRTALFVNEQTTQIHAVSDNFPRILQGIPLDLRSIALNMNRPSFTLNPTSCDAMQVLGSATSIPGNVASLANRFQVGACNALAFKPKLAISLKGPTKRGGNPALTAVVTYPQGSNANIASAQVTLPHSAFLDQSHIRTVCTRVQFSAHACPPASVYGHARAITPLLDKPLEGPVYLRSSNHKLPDLVADLNGQIEVTLDGKIDTGKGGGIRNTFQVVPDAPVSKFALSMQGGKKGLLVNSENICGPRAKVNAIADFTGQNGKVYDTTPLITNSCKAKKKGKSHHH